MRWKHGAGTAALAAFAMVGLSACSNGGGGAPASTDEPLTMWVRSGTAAQSEALVDAWNAANEQQIDITVIPNENYLQRVGTAAGSNDLPDLLTSDGVLTPNYTQQGLFLDITERLESLDVADDLVQAQLDIGTLDGTNFTVPHTVAVSALFQNDILLERAGIDPTVPVTSLEQLAENAAAVAALDGAEGIYLTGNNGGSIGFTIFPSIWASGGEVLDESGEEALLTSDEFTGVFEAFNEMFKAGSIAAASQDETGTTRDEVFASGNVGYLLGSNSVLTNVPESDVVRIGVQGMPGLDGGTSTYVGGDVIGISASSERADAAWDFLAWSLGDEAQLDVLAAGGFLLSRADLAEGGEASDDPRITTLNSLITDGRIPFAQQYGQTFTDANGPWIVAARAALFGDDAAAALADAQASVDASLEG